MFVWPCLLNHYNDYNNEGFDFNDYEIEVIFYIGWQNVYFFRYFWEVGLYVTVFILDLTEVKGESQEHTEM